MSPFVASKFSGNPVFLGATTEERLGVSLRLHSLLFGAGLFCVGFALVVSAPQHADIGMFLQAAATVLVSFNVVKTGLIGFISKPTHSYTEQLVSLAVIASLAAGDYLSAALVPLLLEVGHWLEERSNLGAKEAIKGLQKLCTRKATVMVAGEERLVATEQIGLGNHLVVRPGDALAADGLVKAGEADIDESSVTGESTPRSVGPGDQVFAGTINLNGVLHIKVEQVGERSVLGQVSKILSELEVMQMPGTRIIERAAAWYLPAVVVVAALVLLFTGDLSRFVTVLVVACPCAFVLAAPAALLAAMSTATKAEVLIKNAALLETVAELDTLILDKTGTVTDGYQSVGMIFPRAGLSEDDILTLGASVAFGSRHPASKAICRAAASRNLNLLDLQSFHEISGKGVEALIDGDKVQVGRSAWLKSMGIALEDRPGGGVWIAKNGQAVGFVSLLDQLSDNAGDVVKDMRGLGFSRVVLLTGDLFEIAKRVAVQIEADEVISEVLPTEKLDVVRREQRAGRRVLMVGDGVNDALALSAANIGIAVGRDISDVAIGGADVAIRSGELTCLPATVRLAIRTRRTILENIVIGAAVSTTMLGLAAGGIISPIAGALFHNAGAILVLLNSSKLLARKERFIRATSVSGDNTVSDPQVKQQSALGELF